MLNICDFIQVYVYTTNHHLKLNAALLFWFFGGFRCGVPLFIVMLVVY